MKNRKINQILEAVHRYWELQEEAGGMVANAPGNQGGFGAEAEAKGPRAGYSNRIYLGKGSRKRWMKSKL